MTPDPLAHIPTAELEEMLRIRGKRCPCGRPARYVAAGRPAHEIPLRLYCKICIRPRNRARWSG